MTNLLGAMTYIMMLRPTFRSNNQEKITPLRTSYWNLLLISYHCKSAKLKMLHDARVCTCASICNLLDIIDI